MRVHGRLFAEMTTVRPEVVPFAMEPCIASSQEVGPVPLLSGSRWTCDSPWPSDTVKVAVYQFPASASRGLASSSSVLSRGPQRSRYERAQASVLEKESDRWEESPGEVSPQVAVDVLTDCRSMKKASTEQQRPAKLP